LASGVTSIAGYTWIEDEHANGRVLSDPTFSAGGYGANGIPQVDFSVSTAAVPEPATWITLILGLTICGVATRRRNGLICSLNSRCNLV
jgi:PEP-CTERM motif